MRRIGITMRSSPAQHYHETRDALARDWYRLFNTLGWYNNWLLIPNLGADVGRYIKNWQLEGVILSGGDDVGGDLQRDCTEMAILALAKAKKMPLLGVCRGMQLIHLHEQGTLAHDLNHVATSHQIELNPAFPWGVSYKERFVNVNSFHANIIHYPLPASLACIARSETSCEAFQHRTLPWLGMMWHPEREATMQGFNLALFKWLFGNT